MGERRPRALNSSNTSLRHEGQPAVPQQGLTNLGITDGSPCQQIVPVPVIEEPLHPFNSGKPLIAISVAWSGWSTDFTRHGRDVEHGITVTVV